jgi:lysophospholipase L1-like esterase
MPPSNVPAKPRRRLLARLALAAVGGFVALGLLEVAARVLSSRTSGPSTNPRYVEHDEVLGWRYRPGAALRHATDEFDVEIAIDEHGFRRQTSLPARAPDVLVFGDSFAFGWGVEASETWANRLESELGLAVWNLAVSGFSVDQELLLWRERARFLPRDVPCAPKVVLVLTCGNDLPEAIGDRSYGKAKPRFVLAGDELVLTNVPVPEPWLERHSQAWRSLAKRWYAREEIEPTHAIVENGRDLLATILATFDRECASIGAKLVVITTEDRWLGARLDARGVTHFDLESELAAAASRGERVAFPKDGHWTPRGHAIVAELVARRLRELGLFAR